MIPEATPSKDTCQDQLPSKALRQVGWVEDKIRGGSFHKPEQMRDEIKEM